MSLQNANYIANCKLYLSSKHPDPKGSNDLTRTKAFERKPLNFDCHLCKVISQRADLCKILNQGLYNKYTSSLDYYYTKDINAIIARKRKSFTIKFQDDQIFDDEREFLKKFVRKKEARDSMTEIKNFYTKFKDFPKFFDDAKIYNLMSAMVRKHRRIEYYQVFKGKKQEEKNAPLPEEEQFQFVEMLGESFKQEAIKEEASGRSMRNSQPKTGEQHSIIGISKAFNELNQIKGVTETDHIFSSDYFQYHTTAQNYYQLYSRSDSLSALNDFESMMEEFDAASIKNQQKQQNTQCKPVIKSQREFQKLLTDQIENKSPTKHLTGEKKSIRTGNSSETADKKETVEIKSVASRDSTKHGVHNISQDILNSNVRRSRERQPVGLGGQIVSRTQSQELLKNSKKLLTPTAAEKKESKLRDLSAGSENKENTHRATQRTQSLQKKVSSDNFRYHQPITTTAAAVNSTRKESGNQVTSVQESKQPGRKNIVINIQGFQSNKQEIELKQRWKTTKSSGHFRMPSTGNIHTPIAESVNPPASRSEKKVLTPSSNRYILTKRALGANFHVHGSNSTLIAESGNEGGGTQNQITAKCFKSTSQGNIENQEENHDSKGILEKQGVLEGLGKIGVNRRQIEYEALVRSSKAGLTSKKLLGKVFGNVNTQQPIDSGMNKSPHTKGSQIKIPQISVSQRNERTKISLNIGTGIDDMTQNHDIEKLPSPLRKESGSKSIKRELPLNLNCPPLMTSQASVAKIYGCKQENLNLAPKIMRRNFSSKNLALTPGVKSSPYREPLIINRTTTRRNKSTETREYALLNTKGPLEEPDSQFNQKLNDHWH